MNSRRKLRSVKTAKPNPLKLELKVRHLLKPIETRTGSCLKFKTETEDFGTEPALV